MLILIFVPPHVEIHKKAFETNGITKEHCDNFGVPIRNSFTTLEAFLNRSKMQIAHNAKFDME